MTYQNTGSILIRTYAAEGAFPISGTIVRIFGVDEENRFTEYSVMTDIDGVTESISLPAPSKNFSQVPKPNEAPYALYNIEICAPGYYTKKINNVSVFAGTETLQLVNMIPININQNNTSYPKDNLLTDSNSIGKEAR